MKISFHNIVFKLWKLFFVKLATTENLSKKTMLREEGTHKEEVMRAKLRR